MEKLTLTGNENINKLYVLFNVLCDYQEKKGNDQILELSLLGLKDKYTFKVELAKNIARKEGKTEKDIIERFKPYTVLSKAIDYVLDSYCG